MEYHGPGARMGIIIPPHLLMTLTIPIGRPMVKARPGRSTGPPPYSTTSARKTRTLLQFKCTQIDSSPVPSVCKSEVVTARPPGVSQPLLLLILLGMSITEMAETTEIALG